MWVLFAGLAAVEAERTTRDTLVLRPEGGFIPKGYCQLFRGPGYPIPVGYAIELDGLSVEVLASDAEGRPTEVAFTLDKPFEDTSVQFLMWAGKSYAPFTPPSIGESVRIAPVPWHWFI